VSSAQDYFCFHKVDATSGLSDVPMEISRNTGGYGFRFQEPDNILEIAIRLQKERRTFRVSDNSMPNTGDIETQLSLDPRQYGG
jgi:hypothetical protein